jgi:hypothetical protein
VQRENSACTNIFGHVTKHNQKFVIDDETGILGFNHGLNGE